MLCAIKNENGNYAIAKYKYANTEMKKLAEKEKIHDKDILTCIELNNEIIVSGSRDSKIKLWKN